MSEFEFLRDVTIGQYLPTGSGFHRLDPRAKLLMATCFLIGIVFGDSLIGLIVALAAVFVGLAWARIPLGYALRGLRPVWPFLVLLALFQVLTIPQNDVGTIYWQWWKITITCTDFYMAALTLTRFATFILGLGLFSFATSTTELAHSVEHLLRPLQRLGLPAHEFSLVIVIALRFVPLLAMEMERIVKAQASRGADWGRKQRNVFRRARQMLPLLVPLFITTLQRSETLILAMEARCYMGGKGRTHLIRLQAQSKDVLAVVVMITFGAALLAAAWLDLDTILANLLRTIWTLAGG